MCARGSFSLHVRRESLHGEEVCTYTQRVSGVAPSWFHDSGGYSDQKRDNGLQTASWQQVN